MTPWGETSVAMEVSESCPYWGKNPPQGSPQLQATLVNSPGQRGSY